MSIAIKDIYMDVDPCFVTKEKNDTVVTPTIKINGSILSGVDFTEEGSLSIAWDKSTTGVRSQMLYTYPSYGRTSIVNTVNIPIEDILDKVTFTLINTLDESSAKYVIYETGVGTIYDLDTSKKIAASIITTQLIHTRIDTKYSVISAGTAQGERATKNSYTTLTGDTYTFASGHLLGNKIETISGTVLYTDEVTVSTNSRYTGSAASAATKREVTEEDIGSEAYFTGDTLYTLTDPVSDINRIVASSSVISSIGSKLYVQGTEHKYISDSVTEDLYEAGDAIAYNNYAPDGTYYQGATVSVYETDEVLYKTGDTKKTISGAAVGDKFYEMATNRYVVKGTYEGEQFCSMGTTSAKIVPDEAPAIGERVKIPSSSYSTIISKTPSTEATEYYAASASYKVLPYDPSNPDPYYDLNIQS